MSYFEWGLLIGVGIGALILWLPVIADELGNAKRYAELVREEERRRNETPLLLTERVDG